MTDPNRDDNVKNPISILRFIAAPLRRALRAVRVARFARLGFFSLPSPMVTFYETINFNRPLCVALACVLWFGCNGPLPLMADEPSDYYSLHLEPTEITYLDTAGIYRVETRAGFRYVHDYTDPKVLCARQLGPCTAAEKQVAVRAVNQYLPRFKVYVPAGTTYLQIIIYLPKTGQVATVARFGQPPTGDYTAKVYADFPIDGDQGATLAQLQAADYTTRNAGGHTTLINQYLPGVPPGGGWIYVRVLAFDPSVPIENRYTFRVDVPEFQTWFSGMTEAAWNGFGESGGYIIPAGEPVTPPPPAGQPAVFQKLIDSGDYGQVNSVVITDFAATPATVELRPRLKIKHSLQGPFKSYAALVAGGVIYAAERDIFDRIVFTRLKPDCGLEAYQTGTDSAAAGAVIACDAFTAENLMTIDSDLLAESGLVFFFGVAPAGNLAELQGIVFSFSNSPG